MITLCLDLSTNSTGWAIFEDGKLKEYGALKPKVKGISAMKYPEGAYNRIIDISDKVKDLVADKNPDKIVIEEVNRGINRIAQKSLDALHFFVLDRLLLVDPMVFKKLAYCDSNGKKGWRGKLDLKLDEQDKEWNRNAREFNKKNSADIKKGLKKSLDIIDWKDLSLRYVNKKFKLNLDKDEAGHVDIADAIAMGASLFHKK